MWPIVPFEKAVSPPTSSQPKVQKKNYLSRGQIPVVDQGASQIAGFTNNAADAFKGPGEVIIFGDHTRRFKFVDFPFAIGADGVKVLVPRAGFMPKFLFYYFASITLPNRGYSRHYKFLREVAVPKFPSSEQRKIVEILDQADRLRQLRTEADAKAERILPALFLKMFGDPATNPMRWEKVAVSEMALVTTGNTPSRRSPEFYGNHIDWVKSDNLNTPSHFITAASEQLSVEGKRVGRTAPAGSTLVTCIAGSPDAIGNCAFANEEVAFNQQINAATPRDGTNPMFLYGHFVTGKSLIQSASTGGMKGLVSKGRFSAIKFIQPPESRQLEFAGICEALCARKEVQLQQRVKIDTLFNTLLHRAFTGELTAGWRQAHMKELLQEMEIQTKALSSQELAP